jgi:hypothetical protein
MKMNCTACSAPIDKIRGYYLVKDAPYCTSCHQSRGNAMDAPTHSPGQEPENLLEAFRAYQRRSKAAAPRDS